MVDITTLLGPINLYEPSREPATLAGGIISAAGRMIGDAIALYEDFVVMSALSYVAPTDYDRQIARLNPLQYRMYVRWWLRMQEPADDEDEE